MKRAWEQFALIIFGSMIGVFAFGVYYNMSLDTILLRTLVVGIVLFAIFSLVHTWLTMVFTGSRQKGKQDKKSDEATQDEGDSRPGRTRSSVQPEAKIAADANAAATQDDDSSAAQLP